MNAVSNKEFSILLLIKCFNYYFIHLFFREHCTTFLSKNNSISFREVKETKFYELTICNTN
jgi:hypothetical protein